MSAFGPKGKDDGTSSGDGLSKYEGFMIGEEADRANDRDWVWNDAGEEKCGGRMLPRWSDMELMQIYRA